MLNGASSCWLVPVSGAWSSSRLSSWSGRSWAAISILPFYGHGPDGCRGEGHWGESRMSQGRIEGQDSRTASAGTAAVPDAVNDAGSVAFALVEVSIVPSVEPNMVGALALVAVIDCSVAGAAEAPHENAT